MDSSNFFLLNWLTLSLKDISLSNYSPNFPVLISTVRHLYFGRSRTWQNFLNRSISPSLFSTWSPEISRIRFSLNHLDPQLTYYQMHTFYQNLYFFTTLRQTESNEWIFQLLHSNGAIIVLIQAIEIFPKFQESFIRKANKFLFAMIFEPSSEKKATMKDIRRCICDFRVL